MSIRKKVRRLLEEYDRENLVAMAAETRKAITMINRLLFDDDELIRWRAVEAFGWVAQADPWSLERIVARLVYTMNDDAGQVGWMAPYALGEVCAVEPDLVEDFFSVVISQIDLPVFTAGVLWAIGRVGRTRPDLVEDTCPEISFHLGSSDPSVRGLAAWAAGPAGCADAVHGLRGLLDDDARVRWYEGGELTWKTVAELAGLSLKTLE